MDKELDHHAALVHAMVLVAAAEGRISDNEIATMSRLVRHLPIFADFDHGRIAAISGACADLLAEEDGLDIATDRIARALAPPLRETAYALACDVAAADGRAEDSELRMLELIRHRLDIDRLIAAAIERGAQARHRRA